VRSAASRRYAPVRSLSPVFGGQGGAGVTKLPASAGPDSYRCRWRGQRTTVVINDDSVDAAAMDRFGRVLGRRSVPLRELGLSADRTWHKDERRHKVAGGVVGLAIPIGGFALWRLDASGAAWLRFAVGVVAALAGSVIYSILDPHRVEYAWFRYRSGVTAFTICRSGADALDFDAFVARLEQKIKGAAQL
jgi:hypothetical protein